MNEDNSTLYSVTDLICAFGGWVIMVSLTIIMLDQWTEYDYFRDSLTMFIVMLLVTKLFLYLSWLATKWLWVYARTVLLNRDFVRTCRSVWSEWLNEFRR